MMDPWVDASKIIQVDVRAVNYEQTTIGTDANMIRGSRPVAHAAVLSAA